MIDWTPAIVGNLIFASALIGFALAVGGLARFQGAALWYAIFGASFGMATVLSNVGRGYARGFIEFDAGPTDLGAATSTQVATLALVFAAMAALCVPWFIATIQLARHYGVRAPLRNLWGGLFVVAVMVMAAVTGFQSFTGAPLRFELAVAASGAGFALAVSWMAVLAVLLAWAYVRDGRAEQAILAAAFSAYPIMIGLAQGIPAAISREPNGWLLEGVGAGVAVIAAWWWAYAQTQKRAARRVAWFAVALFLAGGLAGLYWKSAGVTGGIARAIDIGLVGYAILRMQYLGVDVKVRWGISKSTLAGIFVAVIFIASEGAQLVFGDGNEWLGLVAGGLLVFALAPLNRFADRIATKAVPKTEAEGDAGSMYLDAVAYTLKDGQVTAKEELHLAKLADKLGLTTEEAFRLRQEAAG